MKALAGAHPSNRHYSGYNRKNPTKEPARGIATAGNLLFTSFLFSFL